MSQPPTRHSTRSTREKAPPRAQQFDAKRQKTRQSTQRQKNVNALRDVIESRQLAEAQAAATAMSAVANATEPDAGEESTEETRLQVLLEDEARAKFLQTELAKRGHKGLETLDLDELEYRWKNREPTPLFEDDLGHTNYENISFGPSTQAFPQKQAKYTRVSGNRQVLDSDDEGGPQNQPAHQQTESATQKPTLISRLPDPLYPQFSQRATATPKQHDKLVIRQQPNPGLPHTSRTGLQPRPAPNFLVRPDASSSNRQPNLSTLDHRQHRTASSKSVAYQSVAARSALLQTQAQAPIPTINNRKRSAAPHNAHPHKRHHAMPAPKSNSPHQDDAEVNRHGDENHRNESARNKKKSRKRSKPCITDFEGLRKDIARHASQDARAYISASGVFAQRTQIDIWIEQAWRRANQTHNRGQPAMQILPEERTWIRNLLPTLRGAIKDELRSLVPICYDLNEDHSAVDNANRAQSLLPHKFHYGVDPDCNNNVEYAFQHPLLVRSYQLAFFGHQNDLGMLYNNYFNPARSETVAFLCTIIHFLIFEWITGEYIRDTLRGRQPRKWYELHLESLRRFEQRNPKRYRNTMVRLHDVALTRSRLFASNDTTNADDAIPDAEFGEDSTTEYLGKYDPKDFQYAAASDDDLGNTPSAGPSTQRNTPSAREEELNELDELDEEFEEHEQWEEDEWGKNTEANRYQFDAEDILQQEGLSGDEDLGRQEPPRHYYYSAPGRESYSRMQYKS